MLTWWIGDNRVNARKGLKTKSVEFDFRASSSSRIAADLDLSDDSTSVGMLSIQDKGSDQGEEDHGEDKEGEKGGESTKKEDEEFIAELNKTIDSAEEDLKTGSELFVQEDVVLNYQEFLSRP